MEVQFEDIGEIRMGSPFNGCTLKLTGNWIPDLEFAEFQDLVSFDSTRNIAGLVKWDMAEENEPGFIVLVIDESKRKINRSEHIEGCCTSIKWGDDRLYWQSTLGAEGYVGRP